MTGKALTDVTLAVRDAIYEGLLVRRGEVLTEELARERANNTCLRVVEALRELAEANADARARAVEGQDVVVPVCDRDGDCFLDAGHNGPCSPYPF